MKEKRIKKYLNDIKNLKNETSKKETFLLFLKDIYSGNKHINEYLDKFAAGGERFLYNINLNRKSSKKGRADTYFENIIIEFENNLNKTEKHAKSQLCDYLSSEWDENKQYNFNLISSDCEEFIIYYLNFNKLKEYKFNWKDNSILEEKQRFKLNEKNTNDFIPFLNKYIFNTVEKVPNIENFIFDFGLTSNLFISIGIKLKSILKENISSAEVKTAYEQWKKYLSISYNIKIDSEDTFITHTYISIFVKILAYKIISKDDFIDNEELNQILNGEIFYKYNIKNFTEKDFFSWCCTKKNLNKIFDDCSFISAKLDEYNFNDVKEDILKGIYQEFLDFDSKKALGEYYTPDWLCEDIVNKININSESKIIDPSCGSGSFLRAVINNLIKENKNLSASKITNQVFGLDIHPLAVLISKTTILLSLRNKINEQKKPIFLNVYMTNTLLPPIKEELTGEKFNFMINEFVVEIDAKIFTNTDLFSRCLDFSEKLANLHKKEETIDMANFSTMIKKGLNENLEGEILRSFYNLYCGLKKAKDDERDSIWKFVISSLIRPYFFRKYFTHVIGNPPWFPYRDIKNREYQAELKLICENYKFVPKPKYFTHLEIAALFIIHCFENYINQKASISFVLPRSFFQGQQHETIRSENHKNLVINEIWDLKNIDNIFKVPSCVLFFDNYSNKKDIKKWKGIDFEKVKNQELEENRNSTKFKKSTNFYLKKLQNDTAISQTEGEMYKINPYKGKFIQGATIVPRNFYFYERADTNTKYFIKTSEIINKKAKKPWKDKKLSRYVDSGYFYLTALADSLIPFKVINLKNIILPIKILENNIKILNHKDIEENGDIDTAAWFKSASNMWVRNEKSKKMSLYGRLDFQKTLTGQNIKDRYCVIYTSSAKDVCAGIIDRKLHKKTFIAESKTYLYSTDDLDEANYLLAFLNSPYVNEIIKDFQTLGDFGHRDIHTRVLNVPLKAFNTNDQNIVKISSMVTDIIKDVEIFISSKNKIENLGTIQLGKLRKNIKDLLKPKQQKLDELIKKCI